MNRQPLFSIIEVDTDHSPASKAYDWFMLVMITISLLPLTFKTQPALFLWFDRISVIVFIFDYFARWFTADLRYPNRKPIVAFITYPLSFMAIMDLLSILPSLSLIGKSFKAFRTIRLLKLLRLLKVTRYSQGIQRLFRVFKKEREVLFAVLAIAVFYIFTTALIMFNVEVSKPNTDDVVMFNSFFDALYWATTSLTTVGYGDIYPVSEWGRIISMVSSILGIAIIALPSGVITAGYLEELKNLKKEEESDEEEMEKLENIND